MKDTIILDNSPASYIFHPHNAVPVSSWFNDPHDTELMDLCPFLADEQSPTKTTTTAWTVCIKSSTTCSEQ